MELSSKHVLHARMTKEKEKFPDGIENEARLNRSKSEQIETI